MPKNGAAVAIQHGAAQRSGGLLGAIERRVVLKGTAPIMFDQYAGDNKTKLDVSQKLYLSKDGTITMPAMNISSFLSSENTMSAPRRLLGKNAKATAQACLSYVSIAPFAIPFLRDDKPIKFGVLVNDTDAKSGVYVHRCVARLKGGIPNPKERPVLPLPWSLEFKITIQPNKGELKEEQVLMLFREGGMALGLGTYRGVFGKFEVGVWE